MITAIDGNLVTFDQPLEYDHDSPRADLKTSITNYSRSITISSEDGLDSAVHERGHVMFMASDEVDVRFAAFEHLGRTDKSERSFSALSLEEVESDSNVQGRYALHLHQLGIEDRDNPIIIEGNAVVGSRGWGIAQHSSHANLHNNGVAARTGFVWIAQGSTEEVDASFLDQPECIGFGKPEEAKKQAISLAMNNEVFGSERAPTVTKAPRTRSMTSARSSTGSPHGRSATASRRSTPPTTPTRT